MSRGISQPVRNMADNPVLNPWMPLTRVRQYSGQDSDVQVEMSNALVQQRIAMSREAVLELIAASVTGPTANAISVGNSLKDIGLWDNASLDDVTKAGIQRWEEHNWIPSLDLYLWSRRWHFDDNGADFEEARDRALALFQQEEGEPPVRTVSGGRRLEHPCDLPDVSVGSVLWRRSSGYGQQPRSIPQSMLSAILHHGLAPFRMKNTAPPENGSPDYGYLVGLDRVYDLFLAVFDVEGLTPGIYLYDMRKERVEMVREGMFRHEVQKSLIGQKAPLTSGCVLLLSTDFRRIQWVYRHDRVIRNTYINSAKIIHALLLVATAFQLFTSITPAVYDSVALSLLGLDPKESQVLYTLALS